ncbi:MAG: DNA gyrase/topoisomerase IV subunit A [Candidatus Synoicihabitans palmerolidicus]|nr:DNA gyrase/topoisomerase IV subunit A [Candidatus Synoicihabitans palmerolidicus]
MPNRLPPADDQPDLFAAAAEEVPTPPATDEGQAETVTTTGEEGGAPLEKAETTTVAEAPLAGAYKNWFLDYASYVILDRAVPHINDGLKPVQRRILHTLWDKDDGRFHKVANIVGATMAFHPHGDASIEAALVGIAQRSYLIESQGNFGNTLTGDGAAAARYIEARLTPFAREVVFNPKTTVWQRSYDGRAKEPVTLPAKFPLVLLEGVEGIAVGLSTRILPHNFNDLCRASIHHLQGKTFRIRPDFPTGGTADFSAYNDGARGGRVKVRATIESQSKYVLAVTELAYGTTTSSLIDSILSANTKGKIKIKHVDDNTADKVEILIHLPQTADPKQVKQQLYVFTDCQVSLAPAACVIENVDGLDRPAFLRVSDILRRSTDQTVILLKTELAIRLGELQQQWHWDSLERIFLEERIYRRIEKSTTWEDVLEEIRTGVEPFLGRLQREVTDEDITRLTEIRIKRISAYNRFKADEKIKLIEADIETVKHHLANLVDYAIAWFTSLQEKYGKGRKRRTSYDEIEEISAAKVIAANQRLYVDRDGGFVGLNWRQHEYVTDCRPIDQVLCVMADAKLKVCKVTDKVFMGRNILHVTLFDKAAPPEFFTLLYQDKKSGKCFAKRFTVGGVTRDKLYLLAASEGSKVVYFDATKNESSMPGKVRIQCSGRCSARVKDFEFDLAEMTMGTRGAKGVTVTKYPVRKVTKVLGAGEDA